MSEQIARTRDTHAPRCRLGFRHLAGTLTTSGRASDP